MPRERTDARNDQVRDDVGVLRYSHSVSQAASLPAEILHEAGYRTGGIWRNGWVAPNFGFHQGFDLYQKPAVGRRPEQLERGNPSAPQLAGSDLDVTESALEFLRVFGHERWFLYLHYMDVHQYVYDEESARFGTSYSDIYDNSILWVDRNIGRLLSELVDRDLADRTVVVVVSDHGEAFFEHGFEGHARDLHREVTGTPFLLSLPFRLDPGVVVEEQVENVDVWPTLLDLLGLPPLPESDGRSLVPLLEAHLRGEVPAASQRPDFAQLDQTWGRVGVDPDPLVAIGQGSYRLMHRPARPEADQLFDRSQDLMEQNDLAAQNPELVAELRGEAVGYLASPPAPWGAPPEVELDSMELGQLRALGYVIDEGEADEAKPDPEADQGS